MIRKLICLIFLACIFSACASNTSAPTQILVPTATPLLSEINLESLLILNGDLPAGLSGAQIRNIAPNMFKDVPKAEYIVYQQFEKDGGTAGGIGVFVYESKENRDKAYKTILDGMGDTDIKPSSEIGDKANVLLISKLSESYSIFNLELSEALFTRCNAVVHIRMTDNADYASIVSYGKRLDKRLSPIICR